MKAEVWQCGGGTQSARIALGIIRQEFPRPDFALIADTGYERATTWTYMDQVLSPKLAAIGINLIRVPASVYAYRHDGFFNNKGTLLLPAYSTQTDDPKSDGKMSNFCTSYWKRDVLENFMRREHGLAKDDCRKWIGFSIDETRRAVRMMSGADYKNGLIRFPLLDRFIRRRQSLWDVMEAGWPEPPRSNCYMCPNQVDAEWVSLSPEEFAAAVELEKQMRARDPDAYFHRSRVPLDQVVFRPQVEGNGGCDSGECFL